MSAYTDHRGLFIPESGISYRVVQPIDWHIGHIDGPLYRVEAGFVFEVSVPCWLRWLFDPHRADFHKAAALHDHMLENGWSRITAGAEFHNALKADGVRAVRRLVMLIAVLLWKFD